MLGDTRSTIPATKRQPRVKCEKIFVGKAFESIVEMGNLYSIVMENVVAETNDFFQAFVLPLAVFNVFNIE